jgi:hypothetical protein
VRSFNGIGDSAYSNIAVATTLAAFPAAPSGLAATAVAFDQIDLAWTDNASNESGYAIERSPNGSTGWQQIDAVGADVGTFHDGELTNVTRYYYRVRAYNASGESGYSNIVYARTPAQLPGDANGDGAVDVGDLGILGQNYGLTGEEVGGDFNGDNAVDVGDLGILGENYGQSLAPPGGGSASQGAEAPVADPLAASQPLAGQAPAIQSQDAPFLSAAMPIADLLSPLAVAGAVQSTTAILQDDRVQADEPIDALGPAKMLLIV